MKHKRELHIVYIITKLELGGAQKVCLRLFNELSGQGITTTLITGKGGILDGTIQQKSNTFLLDFFHREISLRALWHELKNFISLIRILRSLKKRHPHIIVHTHSTKAGIVGRWAALYARIPIRIHTVHGYAFHNHQNRLRWLCIYIIELCTSFITTHYVCVSSADVKTGLRLFPFFVSKHSIIRAAIDWDSFYIPSQQQKSPRPLISSFTFGTIACFKPQKNIFDLLQAFAHIHHLYKETRLIIIGDGVLRPAIQDWITKHNLIYAISLLGWQNHVATHMQTWNTFVLSSLWEGLPCAVIEARMLKLPVVSYNVGGIHDVIFDQHNGLLYKAKNWQGLANGMRMIYEDKQLYNNLRSYNDNLNDFHYATMLGQHKTLYQKISK